MELSSAAGGVGAVSTGFVLMFLCWSYDNFNCFHWIKHNSKYGSCGKAVSGPYSWTDSGSSLCLLTVLWWWWPLTGVISHQSVSWTLYSLLAPRPACKMLYLGPAMSKWCLAIVAPSFYITVLCLELSRASHKIRTEKIYQRCFQSSCILHSYCFRK